jgi:uncharacterized metal-binding protein
MKMPIPSCASCPIKIEERLCRIENGRGPANCPTRNDDLIEDVKSEYLDPALREFARLASVQEGEGYSGRGIPDTLPRPVKPRILEIVEFSRKMKYSKLGLVFCTGLSREAAIVESFLSDKGFQVVSVICKAGRIPKEAIGVKDDEKIVPGTDEPMCNPVLQAKVMNDSGTDFNIVLGLCVGHDSIFMKYSDAFCTVLAAKDRPTGHNPLAAVYNLESYFRYMKED